MTEAVRLGVRHAFVESHDGGLGLSRLLLRAAATNLGSQGVARAAGFSVAGRDRAAEVLGDGTVDDFIRFEMLSGDWHDGTAAARGHPLG